MTSVLLLGFLIGVRHAFEPDHVAAVASLASKTTSPRQALRQGAVWGLGHTLTLFIVCGAVLLLNTSVSPDLARYLEAGVGGMLMLLGFDVLRRLHRDRVHFHIHDHDDGVTHFHAHSHRNQSTKAYPAKHREVDHDHSHEKAFPMRFLFVGLMHGMAGSAALVVLAMQTSVSIWQGLLYVALFGLGSIMGMALFSAIITIPMRSARSMTWAHNGIQLAIGIGTVLLGGYSIYENLVA